MIVSQLDAEGFFAYTTEADPDPLEPGKFLIPGGCVPLAPPKFGTNQAAKYENGSWKIVPNLRGKTYWMPNGEKYEITQRGEELPVEALLKEPPKPIHKVKEEKKFDIELKRNDDLLLPVMAHGRTWQADPKSRDLLIQSIVLAKAGLPLPAVWRDADNKEMPITSIDDLLAIAGAMLEQTRSIYEKSWKKKEAINKAKTNKAVEDIDWN